jgi:Protein of unknown function (DUF2628)
MIVFTVHEPPVPPADRIDRAEQLEFVRDGFTPLAAAIPPLWMAINKLWIALLLYLLASTALSLVLVQLGVDKGLIALINLAANIVIGFEADSLKRWTLGRRGWVEVGTVVGRNRAECERRFFDGWLIQQPMLRHPGGPVGGDGSGARVRMPKLLPTAPQSGPAAAMAGVHQASGSSDHDGPRADGGGTEPARRPLWRRLFRR